VTIDDLYLQYDYISDKIELVQDRWEIVSALHTIYDTIGKANVIVEIGSNRGGSLCMLSNLLSDSGKIILIDPQLHVEIDYDFLNKYIGKRWYHINKKSADPGVVEELGSIVGQKPIEVLMIDGCHRDSEVVYDHNTYSKYIRKGAEIFHNLCDSSELGPIHAFSKLSSVLQHSAFVSQDSVTNHTMGIGVVYLGVTTSGIYREFV
jgi:cephalosporin hydroxylase